VSQHVMTQQQRRTNSEYEEETPVSLMEVYMDVCDSALHLDETQGRGFSGVVVMVGMLIWLIWYRLIRREDSGPAKPKEKKSAYEPYEPWELKEFEEERRQLEEALQVTRSDKRNGPKTTVVKLSDEEFDDKLIKALRDGDLTKCEPDIEMQRTFEKHRSIELRHYGRKGRGYAATADIGKDALLLDEGGVFALSSNTKKLVTAVLCCKQLNALGVCNVKRCGDCISFLSDYTSDEWAEAWKKVVANKFCINAEGLPDEEMGEMIFAEASFFNHSCGPNAVVSFPYAGRIQIHACEDISMGEEVCIDYWPIGGEPGAAFQCECAACKI